MPLAPSLIPFRTTTMPDLFWDLETRSAASLRLVGPWNYAAHPTTEVLCLCYAIDDGEVQTWVNKPCSMPRSSRCRSRSAPPRAIRPTGG